MSSSRPEHAQESAHTAPPETEHRSAKWWQLATYVLGFLTALVTLIAALQTVKKNDATSKSGDLSSSLSAAQSAKASVETELSSAAAVASSLAAANASLQARLNSSPQPSTPSGTTPSAAIQIDPAGIRHSGRITMLPEGAGGLFADLDVDASNKQWTGPAADIGWSASTFEYLSGARAYVPPAGTHPTYADCHDATAWGEPQLSINTLDTGQYFCYETSQQRYAVVHIISMDKIHQSPVTIDVVVYNTI